jgi:hypothetical protein
MHINLTSKSLKRQLRVSIRERPVLKLIHQLETKRKSSAPSIQRSRLKQQQLMRRRKPRTPLTLRSRN